MSIVRVNQMGPMRPHYNDWLFGIIPVLLGIIILLLVLIIAYLWFFHKNDDKQKTVKDESVNEPDNTNFDKIDVAIRLLNDNEKIIVQALVDSGGEMLQKDISSNLGLSRGQTHRSIQSLIERDMVIAENHFNTKKISLANWLEE
jgi:DNA-binding MarR family transcriptional regulator